MTRIGSGTSGIESRKSFAILIEAAPLLITPTSPKLKNVCLPRIFLPDRGAVNCARIHVEPCIGSCVISRDRRKAEIPLSMLSLSLQLFAQGTRFNHVD
jgi:hypothetical protein